MTNTNVTPRRSPAITEGRVHYFTLSEYSVKGKGDWTLVVTCYQKQSESACVNYLRDNLCGTGSQKDLMGRKDCDVLCEMI